MKLIRLSANRSTFRSLNFQPGLNLIVGDDAGDHVEGDSNGVGKTLSLRLLHHCLGANPLPSLSKGVPDWVFSLDFEIRDRAHRVERRGDGSGLALDDKPISMAAFRTWLDANGGFALSDPIPNLSFRSLSSRFARRDIEDSIAPLRTSREQDFESLLRNLFLLGVDTRLAYRKASLKQDLDHAKLSLKVHEDRPEIRRSFRGNVDPKIRLQSLLSDLIPSLQRDLSRFQVADNYRQLEARANELTQSVRQHDMERELVELQLSEVRQAMNRPADISREDLLKLYDGLLHIFKPEVLEHLSNVEAFHASLAHNRTQRLLKDQIALEERVMALSGSAAELASDRDRILQDLQGKRALDEYAALAHRLAELRAEAGRISEYLDFARLTKNRIQEIKAQQIEDNQAALDYSSSKPLEWADAYFRSVVKKLFPEATAGIAFEANTGDNKIRYNLEVVIDAQDSDGVGNASVLCYDWILSTRGRHEFGFLWHDNRLFADMHARPRAAWFRHVISEQGGRQYIASINRENYEAMGAHLSHGDAELLKSAEIITLRGDKDENRLLGIRFGQPPSALE